jgi:predicted outer membrane protein
MLDVLGLVLLFADTPQDTTTLPRRFDDASIQQQQRREGTPTDPWFDKQFVATDDPAFIITAVDSGRQGIADAQALGAAASAELADTARKLESQSRETTSKLESLAGRKGWRLPEQNPDRAPSVTAAGPTRTRANFIVRQIAYHQATIAMFRAQLAGKGDAELKRALRETLPGYEKNLRMLLELPPSVVQ